MIEELVNRYGADAVLRITPDILEDGELVGWIVELVDPADQDVGHDLEVRAVSADGDDGALVLLLIHGGDEVELDRRPAGNERAEYRETLGALRARVAHAAR